MDDTTLTLLTNRLLMAQGGLALLDKNLQNALTLCEKCVNVSSITDAQEQEQNLGHDSEQYELLLKKSSIGD